MARHKDGERSGWLVRRTEVTEQLARLEGYGRRSNAQEAELDELVGELTVLSGLIDQDDVQVRRSKVERGRALMTDPANREGPETAAELIQRTGNPWRQEGGPLNRETGAGLISRAHSMVEGLASSGAFVHDGAEKLAQALAESSGWPGMTVKRSRDEQAQAAELFLALSNPHYAEAFRSVLRYPQEFMGAGGTGFETLTDDQRQAWREVRTNMVCRAAFAETSGAVSAYALPLQLDPNIVITNAGVAGPFRKLARVVLGTSNVWEGIGSAGTTANWVAEGAAVTDTTPTLAQIAITPYKSAVWIYGSFEAMTDTDLAGQVPMLVDEARYRLETTAFTTGTGSAQPYGVITRGASDATPGALTAAMIYALHQNLAPRFRVYDGARPAWIGNVAIQDACRQVPIFTGAVTALLNDNIGTDRPPMMLGIDFYEASAMDPVNTAVAGHKNLALGDFSQLIIVDRQPNILLYDPLVLAQASALPSGQRGWYSWARTGSDITTPAAAYGSNAFVFHTT
jgi:HK97 family phage major capsid protein